MVRAYFLPDRNDARGKPALVAGREPFAGIQTAFAAAPAAVDLRSGEREVQGILGEAGAGGAIGAAKAAVVGLGDGDDVLDVGVARAREVPSGVGAVDTPAKAVDDDLLDGLAIGVVAAVVGSAAVLRSDDKPAPGVAGRGDGEGETAARERIRARSGRLGRGKVREVRM